MQEYSRDPFVCSHIWVHDRVCTCIEHSLDQFVLIRRQFCTSEEMDVGSHVGGGLANVG